MRTLSKTLVQPIQDYASVVWAPALDLNQLQLQEGPLRSYTRRIFVFEKLNYWQRLNESKLFSIQRRNERFRILYTWKSLYSKVPSLGFKCENTLRNGKSYIQDYDIPEKGLSANARRD